MAESQIAEFEGLAKSFAEGRLVKNVLKETKKRVAAAEYYVKVMERTLDRGSTYPRTERDRLKKMLKAGGLKPEKAEEMEGRIAILTTYIRAILNNRDKWKRYDAKLSPPKSSNPPESQPAASPTETKETEEVVLDEEDHDL